MKKQFLLLSLASLSLTTAFAASCSTAPQTANTAANKAVVTNSSAPVASTHSQTGAPHSQTDAPAAANSQGSNAGRNPMERPVDLNELNETIAQAETNFKQKPKDAAAKNALADAYFARATALTEAAQYRAALGDYRRGLKLNPNDEEANKSQAEILRIFKSLNREPPKEGEEPAPLPFAKEA